jgi:transposase
MSRSRPQEQSITIRYSTAFKLKVVEQIEQGELTVAQARRLYDIRGGQTIQRWLVKHGKSHLLSRVVHIEMKDEKDRVKQLEAEKKQLESALAQATVKNLFLEKVIELAKEEYGIDVKKNFGTEPSTSVPKKKKRRA